MLSPNQNRHHLYLNIHSKKNDFNNTKVFKLIKQYKNITTIDLSKPHINWYPAFNKINDMSNIRNISRINHYVISMDDQSSFKYKNITKLDLFRCSRITGECFKYFTKIM